MDLAEVINKGNFTNDMTLNRFYEKAGAFFNSFIMPGEKAEARPALPEDLSHTIPRF